MDFGYLEKYSAAGKTTTITLTELPQIEGKHPSITIRYAGPGNDAYLNAVGKASWSSGMNPATNRLVNEEIKARIFADTVVTGWADVYAGDPDHPGCVRPIPYSVEAAFNYLLAIAKHKPMAWLRILNAAASDDSFVEDVAPPKVHAEDLGKE
jgi:hypothetical protein